MAKQRHEPAPPMKPTLPPRQGPVIHIDRDLNRKMRGLSSLVLQITSRELKCC
jgi:hypothetical protein